MGTHEKGAMQTRQAARKELAELAERDELAKQLGKQIVSDVEKMLSPGQIPIGEYALEPTPGRPGHTIVVYVSNVRRVEDDANWRFRGIVVAIVAFILLVCFRLIVYV